MRKAICMGFALTLAIACGGWGRSAASGKGAKKAPAKTEKVSAKKAPSPMDPARRDSLRIADSEQRHARVKAHQQEMREQYLSRMTPEERARAEEAERRREPYLRVRDSLNEAYVAEMRARMRQRAEAQKAEAGKAKPVAKPASVKNKK